MAVTPIPSTRQDGGTPWDERPVSQLDSVAAIEAALESTLLAQAHNESYLEELMAHGRSSAVARGATLAGVRQRAAAMGDDVVELVSLLDSAARKGEGVAGRVRMLDEMMRNGKKVLKRVEGVLEVRKCAKGAKDSLVKGDLRGAAAFVQIYRRLDDDVKEDESSLPARGVIEGVMQDLVAKVRERVDKVVGKDKVGPKEVLSSVDLFVPLGLEDEGLERFANWVKAEIAIESEQDIRSQLMEKKEDGFGVDEPHVIALKKLFEAMAGYIHESEEPLKAAFGPSSLGKLIIELQKQCDVQAKKILTRYVEERSLDEISRATRASSANAQDLGVLLDELIVLSQRTAAYFSFLLERAKAAEMDSNEAEEADSEGTKRGDAVVPGNGRGSEAQNAAEGVSSVSERALSIAEMLESSELSKWSERLATHYVTLESYVMQTNVSKAISIDAWQSSSSLTSTVVDDLFYVLKESVRRARVYGSSSSNTLVAILHNVTACMTGEFVPHIRSRLREAQNASLASSSTVSTNLDPNNLLSSVTYIAELAKANIPLSSEDAASKSGPTAGATAPAKYDLYVALNNATISGDYALRLRGDIERWAASEYSSVADRSAVDSSLGRLNEVSRTLKQIAERGLTRLVDALTGPLRLRLDRTLSKADYVVAEGAYNEDGLGTFVIGEVDAKVLRKEMEERLTEEIWDGMVRKVAEWTAEVMEIGLFLGQSGAKFNALGGLKADREVRELTSWFAAKARRATVRDVFLRLTQCAMIVGLEKMGEIHDIWGEAAGMTWRLTPVEVKKVMAKRVDFRQESVRALRL